MPIDGRKPKPTAIKRLEGNPGLRPLNDREPRPRVCIPRCPVHVKGVARREWHRIGAILARLGVLTEADRVALEIYCVTYQHWIEAEAMIAKSGLVIKGKYEKLIMNPFFVIAQRTAIQLQTIMCEFGLTPSSRSRLSIPDTAARDIEDVLAQAEQIVADADVQ
jgi:P27 family predicted phage terminase small subunit